MGESDAIVREAQAGDLAGVVYLYRHLHPGGEPLPPGPRLRAVWREMLDAPPLRCYVAEAGGRLVATCTLAIVPNLTYGGRPYGLIENVVTHAGHRRRGYGTAVLRRALAEAWRAGCYKVMLFTGRDLDEVGPFYEQAGFLPRVKAGFVAFPPGEGDQPSAR